MIRAVILMCLTTWVISACSSPDANTGIQLHILSHAGSVPEGDWDFLSYPAHYGRIGDYHVLLISKAPKPGSKRSVKPVGMLTVMMEDRRENWIVANDAHQDFDIDRLETIDDLITHHNGIKSTLESWIVNRKGIGKVTLKAWKKVPSFEELENH